MLKETYCLHEIIMIMEFLYELHIFKHGFKSLYKIKIKKKSRHLIM